MVDARKEKIGEEAAWELLQAASSIAVAKGKKVLYFSRRPADKAELLKQAIGPSGSLRAPTLKNGEQVIIGFHPELYAERLK